MIQNVPLGGFSPQGPPAVPYDPEKLPEGFAVTVPAQASQPPSPCAGRCNVDQGPQCALLSAQAVKGLALKLSRGSTMLLP